MPSPRGGGGGLASPPATLGVPSPPVVNSPLSPFSAALSATSLGMASRQASSGVVVEYNPQQWGPRGPTGGAYIPHSQLSLTAAANPENGGENALRLCFYRVNS